MYGKLAIASVDVWIRFPLHDRKRAVIENTHAQSNSPVPWSSQSGGTRPLRRCLDPPLRDIVRSMQAGILEIDTAEI